jgi:serine/threonine protein kinase/tetratricopeptide (TPR) repeat protein
MPIEGCLDDETIAAHVSGAKEPAVDAHLAGCAACRARVLAHASALATSTTPGSDASAQPAGARVIGAPSATLPSGGSERRSVHPPGGRVGRYEIVRKIGQGAMGVVYAARDHELGRAVALKTLLRGAPRSGESQSDLLDARWAVRLVREARTMATLAHPNVVTVYDVFADGADTWIAMEYVEGTTLRAWLAAAPRTRDQIVARFVEAGRGLSAAHAVGIVHRDFKPENVLVGSDERARISDFGLARPIERGDDPAPRRTIAGTPAYMAPEQIDGAEVDARTDQFSFAVALYEALAGCRPFPVDDLTARRTAIGSRRIAPAIKPLPRVLRRALSRALDPDPAARFPSIDELLVALSAHESSARIAWLATASVTLGAIGIAIVTGRSPAKAAPPCGDPPTGDRSWSIERRRAIEDRFRSVANGSGSAIARLVSVALDARFRDLESVHAEVCASPPPAHDQRLRCLARRRDELETLVAAFVAADAQVVLRAPYAVAQATPAEICRRAPPDLPEVDGSSASIRELDDLLARASAFATAAAYADAAPIAERVLEGARARGTRSREAAALELRARIEEGRGDRRAARDTLLSAATAAEGGRADLVAARVWISIVRLSGGYLDEPSEVPFLAQRASAAIERLGDPRELRGALLHAIGLARTATGDYPAATRILREAIALVPEGAALDRGDRAVNLALALREAGELDDARLVADDALAARAAVLGEIHPAVAEARNLLGTIDGLRGDLPSAIEHHRRALSATETALGPEHEDVALGLGSLALALVNAGRATEAVPLYERARAIRVATYGAEHSTVALVDHNLGYAHLVSGDLEAAERHYRRALDLRRRLLGGAHFHVAYSLLGLASVALERGQLAAAESHARESLSIREKVLGERSPELGSALTVLGRIALAAGRPREALVHLERASALVEGARMSATKLADPRFALARALVASDGDRVRAQGLAETARLLYVRAGLERDRKEVDAFLRSFEP